MFVRRWVVAVLAVALLAATAACQAGLPDARAQDGRLRVVTSFYPLRFLVEQIGGDAVEVASLTPPGVEPHDYELTPRQVGSLTDPGLVVYAADFQPAVDAAVRLAPRARVLDVGPAARLQAHPDQLTRVGPSSDEHDEHGALDPHFWLDPVRYAAVAREVAAALTRADPDHAARYAAGLAGITGRLYRLDRDLAAGLRHCARTELVTSHAAFGYLAQRYRLRQVAVQGLTPDREPTPSRLEQVAAYVQEHHVTTIYAETMAAPAVARAVAAQTGARVAALDPIEGITDESAAADYFGIMRADLDALRTGLGCR